jgi:hypothetical protein
VQPRHTNQKVEIPDVRDYASGGGSPGFNRRAHTRDRDGNHRRWLLYQSAATLATGDGSPFQPMFSGRLVALKANVKTAPSGAAFQCDIEMDGTTIFNGGFIEIPAGATTGYRKFPDDKVYLYADKKYLIDIKTISSAVGPLILQFEIIPRLGGRS